ncbi:hypothetical protein CPB86DRAFT_781268, partial [Serendipita vermifera]
YQPFQIASVNDSRGYNWTIELPAGREYILTMEDANGYTGGTSFVLQVADSQVGTNCGTDTLTPNNLTISLSGTFAQCSGLVVKAEGGTAPYTMQIIGASRPPKTTTWTTSTMSYTIDMGPSEPFFVLVTDAEGRTAMDGIHEVGVGDNACFEVASTVTSGNLPTTLSYDPSSTVSIPTRTSTGTGARTGSTSNEKKVNTPAIIGGTLGGVAFLALILLILFLLRRRANKRRDMLTARPVMKGPMHPGGPYPGGTSHLTTPGPEHAPLMAQGDLMYSAATATTLSPGLTYESWTRPSDSVNPTPTPVPAPASTPHAYANPVHSMHLHHHSSSGADRQSLTASLNNRSDSALPPGAMAPVRMGSFSSGSHGIKPPTMSLTNAVGEEGRPEKAGFTSSSSVTNAPPPYSAAQAYRL